VLVRKVQGQSQGDRKMQDGLDWRPVPSFRSLERLFERKRLSLSRFPYHETDSELRRFKMLRDVFAAAFEVLVPATLIGEWVP
jgi:hypothetical protein